MTLLGVPILSFLVFFPLVGALALALVPRSAEKSIKYFAFGISLLEFAASLPLYFRYVPSPLGMQFVEHREWLPAIGSSWHLGIDGLSLFLVLLTTALTAIAVLGSFDAIKERVRAYYMVMLALETGMLGTFVALDMIVFYIFWEAMLVHMYLLIGVWGGQERIRAAVKFFLYTMTGSVLMLVAILWLYFLNRSQTGVATFDLLDLYRTYIPLGAQTWLFLASRWRSRSRCPCSRSTPGCRWRTSRRPPPARSSWRPCCSRWAPMGSCASPCRCSPTRRTRSRPSSSRWP